MTIAQQIKWDFKTNGSLEILDKDSNLIYFENAGGWDRHEYNSKDQITYYENSDGYWVKREFDSQGNEIYWENSMGGWVKHEYDSQGNVIYYENSNGKIIDHRPKPCLNKEIVIEGIKYKLVKV